jgi:hypothetical protein
LFQITASVNNRSVIVAKIISIQFQNLTAISAQIKLSESFLPKIKSYSKYS